MCFCIRFLPSLKHGMSFQSSRFSSRYLPITRCTPQTGGSFSSPFLLPLLTTVSQPIRCLLRLKPLTISLLDQPFSANFLQSLYSTHIPDLNFKRIVKHLLMCLAYPEDS